ncbi:MAG: O-antigen ligase family protein [Desulfocapsa sp.]|nr:O-antigen ligase family protein [Desulfocapsa sp.]
MQSIVCVRSLAALSSAICVPMKKQAGLKTLLFFFFAVNLLVRGQIVFSSVDFLLSLYVVAFLAIFIGIIAFPKHLRYPLWAFSLSFPLYGVPSALYTGASVLEFLLSAQSIALLIVSIQRDVDLIRDKLVSRFLLLYVLYSFLSVFLFPTSDYTMLLQPAMFLSGWEHVLYSNNWTSLYSLASLNRLALFVFSALLIVCQKDGKRILKGIFVGMLISGIVAAMIGVLHQWDILNFNFSASQRHEGRLQSVFAHPICFSMYISLVAPFILYSFLQDSICRKWKLVLYGVMFLFAIALVYSGSRASWLVYPFCLAAGGGTVYYLKQGKHLLARAINCFFIVAVISVVAGFIIASQGKGRFMDSSNSTGMVVSAETLKIKFSQMLQPVDRLKIVQDTLLIVKEAPFFGLGYESFGWHTYILSQIPQSMYSGNGREIKSWATPHNMYLTHLVNGGVVGLLLWLTLIGIVCSVLIADVRVNNALDNIPVLFCIVSFHLYGMAESMQFNPLIWYIIFLCIAYATAIRGAVVFDGLLSFFQRWFVVCCVFVLLGGAAYVANFQSSKIAGKYGLIKYYDPSNLEQVLYSGFNPPVSTPFGMIRWMGKRGSVEITNAGVMEFDMIVRHPDIIGNPVLVTVCVGGKVIDKIRFTKSEIKKRRYYFSKLVVGKKMNIRVSRTWNPKRFGAQWGRIQGIAITAPRYLTDIPENGIGFSVWETMLGELPGWAEPGQQYRWSEKSATIRVDDILQQHGATLYLRSRHPDVIKKPVEVQIKVDGKEVDSVVISTANWQRLFIDKKLLVGKKALSLYVSRTWNPELMGISADNRDLGIAVAIP